MTQIDTKARLQILVAEDDEVNQSIIRAFLSGSNMDLTVTSDGREALEAALLRKFDLMIVDQNMPFITGDRVIRHLRAARSVNATTPVIRFTADAELRSPDPATLAGSLEVTLPKPLRKEVLVATVRAMLGNG